MKKLSVIFILLFAIGTAYGQKDNVKNANNNLRKGQLDKALQSIEPAISDASTMNDPKTWFYRGNIYLQIHMSENQEYKNLDPNALTKAYESYDKMLELDQKKQYYTEAIQNLLIVSEQLYNQGVEQFTNENFTAALESFEKAAEVGETFGNTDTLSLFNAGLSAENAGNNAKAIEHYSKVLELNYPQPLIYNSLSNIYMAEKDTLKAFATIEEGREKYPDDFNLLIAQTNLYLTSGQTDKAMSNLSEAIKKDPTNPTIYYAVGVNYATMNNLEEAEKAYLKAVELKPDYFEANYNLGALYVNRAAEILNEANKLKLNDPNYAKMKEDADAALKLSIPYLETAQTIDASDKSTLLALKEIYTRLGMYDKLKEVNEKLDTL
jgi:tetratricopeptide (TPR) repeat protein